MTDADLDSIATRVSNWGRWGGNDQRGTLNLLTPELTAAAAALIRSGETISLGRSLRLDRTRNSGRVVWRLFQPVEAAAELITVDFHGGTVTHLDALNHIHQGSAMFNGYQADEIQPRSGSKHLTVETMAGGVAGRGVLLDVAAVIGARLAGHEVVTVAHLQAAEEHGAVRAGKGDLVFVRTGADPELSTSESPGLAAECALWLHERSASVLASDVANDVMPASSGRWPLPIHQLCIFHMGMPLVDNCDLEEIARFCTDRGRNQFFCVLAPLRVAGGTGSPLNPIAVF